MHYGILRRADVADVVALATKPGPMTLYPALKVAPQATAADFDARHPEGPDHVIVPMSRHDDPAVLQWIKSQAAKGAIVIGVCAGATVVGNAGLLDGKRATTQWYFLEELRENIPRSATSQIAGSWSTGALRRRRGSPRRCRWRSP
jgi:transcriptional regulator GlxA family with amidase domain